MSDENKNIQANILKTDLLIIGGGPAGLTAGLYAVRGGLDAVLIEKGILGGQVVTTYDVENYPGFAEAINGSELIEKMEKQAVKFGLKIKTMCEALKIDIKDHKFYTATGGSQAGVIVSDSLVLASGNLPKKLGAPGEEKLAGRGVSYCATCDGALYRNREIAVIGGGDTALTEALFLTNFASKIHLVHRRDKFRGEKIYSERILAHPKINVIWDSVLESINGGEFVESINIKNLKTSTVSNIKLDGVFIFVGLAPSTEIIKNSPRLSEIINEQGYIITDETCKTKIEGVFAAGDVRADNFRQIVVACANGATAAHHAYHYIDEARTGGYPPR